jgi:hypothetical protein
MLVVKCLTFAGNERFWLVDTGHRKENGTAGRKRETSSVVILTFAGHLSMLST